eukprot:5279278-Amphidinium_carterae.1
MREPKSIFKKIRPSKCRQRLELEFDVTCVDCIQKLPSQKMVSGPRVDSATLQLIGVLFASILLPGLASLLMAQQQKHR